jgi:hypothetical protein
MIIGAVVQVTRIRWSDSTVTWLNPVKHSQTVGIYIKLQAWIYAAPYHHSSILASEHNL